MVSVQLWLVRCYKIPMYVSKIRSKQSHGYLLCFMNTDFDFLFLQSTGIITPPFNIVRIRKASAERELNPNRKSAIELSMRAFITKFDGNVVNPAIGTSFDSLDEAYQFYNLYYGRLDLA